MQILSYKHPIGSCIPSSSTVPTEIVFESERFIQDHKRVSPCEQILFAHRARKQWNTRTGYKQPHWIRCALKQETPLKWIQFLLTAQDFYENVAYPR